ncbi:Fibritin C-terminal [uncultured Caudovirales phage]|uniref:Fibritin C-terminal n=1 Tax=uncultured Caudovirales phage TaxID=2100421 RepID=A0A6J5QQ50_9CAUD|nr:Fibritin C-terminal [uncultured Caudovirales phage]CAB4212863.1 Fibritin C-terminal [uncultured Caudovirales phage]CAB5228319.1 Fibritin C-terminal [uncultured Caudovirales phage]
MSQPPGPYERSYSFTDFSTNNPNAQQPGQKIDQELNNVLTALNNTQDRLGELQADDGKLRETCLRMDTLGPAVAPFVSASAIDAINTAGSTQLTAVNTAGSTQVGLVNAAGVTVLSDINAVINSSYAVSAIAASVSASNHAADAYDSRQRADASRVQAANQAGLAAYARDRAEISADNANLSAINAQASKNIAQSFAGSCNTLKNAAQSAATLAEYWNGLAQAASASAEASAADARSVVENALTITLEGIQPYVDAAATSAYEASGYAAASAGSAASADASAQSISSAGYITDAPSDGTTYGRNNGAWAVVGSGGGSFTGGIVTSPIIFDGTSGQYISKGNFDTSRGGNYGISLVCSIGYEFNWQAGWLTTTNQGSTTPRPLYLDSLAGTTLRVWNSSTDTGTEVTHNGIVMNGGAVIDMAASTTDSEVGGWGFGVELTGVSAEQSTVEYNQIRTKNAEYSFTATPTQVKVFEDTNNLGVTIAHDSIAIQHIDTPNVTAYVTNEYIGFEDLSGTPHSAFVEHDVITVQNETGMTQMRATGITFPDATVQTTSASPVATVTVVTGINEYYSPTTGNTVYVFDTSTSAIQLPENVLFPVGTQMVFVNTDGSTLSFDPLCEGAGVVTSSGGKYTFGTTGAVCAAIKLSLSPITWVITGELTA